MKSIVIVDDHILIAKAIANIVNEFSGFNVLYECENGMALQAKFKQAKNIPDIVLLDISMPLMDGFETAKWLKENYPAVLILALSMQNDDESLIKMIKNGAKGYLLKNAHPSELELALNQLLSRGYYYPEWAASKVFQSLNENHAEKNKLTFTDREKELLSFICSELTYKEIADIMHLSPKTIDGYREDLFQKLEIKSRVGLAMFAMKNGFCKD